MRQRCLECGRERQTDRWSIWQPWHTVADDTTFVGEMVVCQTCQKAKQQQALPGILAILQANGDGTAQ